MTDIMIELRSRSSSSKKFVGNEIKRDQTNDA